ncbi:hypothetical protein KSF73_13110 [Burkholderiaceae bacterium DAT-1]|nr:hypothetical protein [Burkholderiaceae bacterium DAT-1]
MSAIHIPYRPLIWQAGHRALSEIRDNGLRPERIGLIPGAAGGPKALCLSHLDQTLFGTYLAQSPRHRHLIGSSIGGWRMACVMQSNPAEALATLAEVYTAQAYPPKVTPDAVAQKGMEMLRAVMQTSPEDWLANPHYSLTVTTVRARGPFLASEHPALQLTGIIGVAAANVLSRNLYAKGWERVWFSSGQPMPAPLQADFPTRTVQMTSDNALPALMATGAIPLVVSGVDNPSGAPAGRYRDGGLLDYHLDLPYPALDDLVLYPHFYGQIKPGWFDKSLSWRQAHRLDNVLMLSPSPEFVARLPYGKIPDRNDFKTLDDATRQRYWQTVIAESQRLADDFNEHVSRGDLHTLIQPFKAV